MRLRGLLWGCFAVAALLPLACGDDASHGNPAGSAGEAGADTGSAGSDSSGGTSGTSEAGAAAVEGGATAAMGGETGNVNCTPRDELPNPVTTTLTVQSTCQAPAACGGDLDGTEWAYSEVCLDRQQIFQPVYDECPTSQLNGPGDVSIVGALTFAGGTATHTATITGTGVFQIPVECHSCDCKGEQELLKQNGAGSNTYCYPECYPDLSCRCLVDFEVTVTQEQPYQVAASKLSLQDGTAYDFCASDASLSLTETSPTPSLPGTATLIPVADTVTLEICDGLDNDKDGTIDNDPVDCPAMPCNNQGVCAGVRPACTGGWTCDNSGLEHYEATSETTCDGLDNDCDGEVDEELLGCYEICDGLDNDNDGTIDDDPAGSPCSAKLGVCATGVTSTCLGEDGWHCDITSPDYEAEESTCGDAKDNDCDGQVDEGCSCPFGKSQMFVVQWQPTPALIRADLDGMNAAPVPALSGFALTQIAVDAKGNKLYWGDGSNKIQRSNLDGSGIEVLWSGKSQTWDVNVATGLFLGECDTYNICRLSTPNTTTTLVQPAAATWVHIDPVNQHVWWADHQGNYEFNFVRANFDGSNVTGIGKASLSAPLNFEIDPAGQKIYWQKGQAIYEVGTDGSNEQELVPLTNSYVYDIAVDHNGGQLYFTEINGSQVRRVGLDGTNNEQLIPNVGYGVSLDLYLCP